MKCIIVTGLFRVRIAERQTLDRLCGDVVQTRHAGAPRSGERAVQLVCRERGRSKIKNRREKKNDEYESIGNITDNN